MHFLIGCFVNAVCVFKDPQNEYRYNLARASYDLLGG